MEDIDIAWFAGLFEGEGTFHISKEKKADCIGIQMTDKDILDRVQSIFGGSVSVTYEAKENWKTCYRWRASVAESDKIVDLILPFLGERRRKRAEFWKSLREPVKHRKDLRQAKKQAMLDALAQNVSQRQVAAMFDVSQPYVAKVLREAKV